MLAVNIDRCRCWEVSRHLLRKVSRNGCWQLRNRGTTHQNHEQKLDRSTRYREVVGIVIRKSWRSSKVCKVLRRYWGGVEPAFKTSFLRWEKHRHECNPTCNSTNDPINILSSQNNLPIKILSTLIKNTHTKQV